MQAIDQSPHSAQKTVDVVNGTFARDDAREILMGIVNKQINTYKLRNWGSTVNYEECCSDSMKRIQDLNEMKSNLESMLNEARMLNKNIRIVSNFSIELTD